jgi:D-lactate dehydrogenase (cytochrome)
MTTLLDRPAIASALPGLQNLLGERLSTRPADRDHHGHGESYHPTKPPDAVAWPVSTAEVVAVVNHCRTHNLPIVPFGAGTSLEGHVTALHGGISLDMSRMNKIQAVRPEDMDATVEAGVTRKQLNSDIRDTGLFFPIDPGADATIGGMAATRASGTNAVRYGTMRENVIAMTVVLADGRVVKTANRARKSSAGYDLTRLFVGSEGTLGIITEVTLRLHGLPEAMATAICSFPDCDQAVQTAIETIQSGIPVARMELLDDNAILAVNRFAKLDYPPTATLFFEFHGSPAAVEEQATQVAAIAEANAGSAFRWAHKPEERSALWQARHDFHYASLAMRPGSKAWGTDVCVPISALADCIRQARVDAATAPFFVTCLGHVGDGNFHMGYLIKMDDPEERAIAERLNDRLVHHAISLGGTCTGEHGIGYGKARFLRTEHGNNAIDLMHGIKTLLDPTNLLNPGKVLPE